MQGLFRLCLSLAAITAVACTCTPTPPPPCGRVPFPSPEAPLAEPLHFVGDEVEKVLSLDVTPNCTGDAVAEVQSVAVQVYDAQNRRVEATATTPERVELAYQTVWRTTVRFTGAQPDSYHLLATFDPGIGLVQTDLWVSIDRRAPPAFAEGTPGAACDSVERTSKGAALCRLSGSEARLFRNGVQAAQWPNEDVRTSGDGLWAVGLGLLSHSVDTGSGAPQYSAGINGSFLGAFNPQGSDVVAFASSALEWRRDQGDAGLALLSRTNLAGSSTPTALAWVADAGMAIVSEETRSARVPMVPGASALTPRWVDHQGVLTQEPTAVWVVDGAALRRISADPSVGDVTLVPPTGWSVNPDLTLVISRGEVPLLFPMTAQGVDKARALLPIVKGTQVTLAYFEALTGAEFLGVAQSLLYARKGTEHYFYRVSP